MLVSVVSVALCLLTSILAAPVPQPLAEPAAPKLIAHWRVREPAPKPTADWRRNAHDGPIEDVSYWRERMAQDEPEPVPEPEPTVTAAYSSWRARKAEVQERREGNEARELDELAKREPQVRPPGWRTGP